MEITITEFNEFTNELYPELLRAAYRRCRKLREMAEDAVQNTLLLAYEKLDNFRIVNPNTPKIKLFRGWLHRILVNMISQMWTRKNGAPKPHQQKFAYASFVYCPNTHTVNFSEYESLQHSRQDYVENHIKPRVSREPSDVEYILKAIDELPHREVAKLAFVDGFTAVEIAAKLGYAQGTIRRRIWEARGQLREKLANYTIQA